MPTGYTYYIENGDITKATDFIMLCARSFGARVEMRDESLSKPIPKEFKADDFYEKKLEEEKLKLAKYRAMSISEAQKRIDERHEKEISETRKSKENTERLRSKYLKILRDVKAWIPPTPEHDSLKNFAIEQIKICIPDMSFYERTISRTKPDAEVWLKENINACIENIERYQKHGQEENERVASRNRWIKDLRESFLEGGD